MGQVLPEADSDLGLPCGADTMHQAGGVADGYLLAVAGPKVSARESQHSAPKHRA